MKVEEQRIVRKRRKWRCVQHARRAAPMSSKASCYADPLHSQAPDTNHKASQGVRLQAEQRMGFAER